MKPTDSIWLDPSITYPADLAAQFYQVVAKSRNLSQKVFPTGYNQWVLDAITNTLAYNAKLERPFNPFFVLFQQYHETNGYTSEYCYRDGNLAGIGIWDSGVPSPWTGRLTPLQAAITHLAELEVHARKDAKISAVLTLYGVMSWDSRHIQAVWSLRNSLEWPDVQTIQDFRQPVGKNDFVWAADQKYAIEISDLANTLWPEVNTGGGAMGVNIGNRKLRIAIGTGHANTSGGNEFELAINRKVTNEVIKLLRNSDGFDVRCYTPGDGLGYYNGPLDAAAAQVRTWLAQGWAADILHEVHQEGLGVSSVRGGFVIYPDSEGLTGRNPGNIDLDVQAVAGPMASAITSAYGGTCRYVGCGRGMSEKETGVGEDGFRLGIFGAWSEDYFNNNSFQFITEGATYTNPTDLALMQRSDFPAKQAKGIVQAYVVLAKQRGLWTYPYSIDGGSPVPGLTTPDGLPYPDGLDVGLLKVAFGNFVGAAPGNPNFRYNYNERGEISGTWYKFYKPTGKFPAVVQSFASGERWYIFFADGNVLWRPNAKTAWKFTKL